MVLTPQIEPITRMARDHRTLVAKLKNGPVFLASRSKTTAVMVAPEQWDETMKELARLRRIVEMDRQLAQMSAGDYVEFDITQKPT